MNKIAFQIFGWALILLLSSCCKKVDNSIYLNIKYPKLSGYASQYKARMIRTVRGDFSKAIDTVQPYLNNNMELSFNFSKETLPEDPVNQPDYIILIYLRATNSNNLTQDSLLYRDSISNIQYEVGRCNIENLTYEFNGVATDLREIIIEN